MFKEISKFFHGFKNKMIEADEIANKYKTDIKEFSNQIKKKRLDDEFEDNFLTILGYSYRLDDINQRLFFTFQKAVYAIDLDILMRNEESKRTNSVVYILVLDTILDEMIFGNINEDLKERAIKVYKNLEEKKAKENQKYHVYQY